MGLMKYSGFGEAARRESVSEADFGADGSIDGVGNLEEILVKEPFIWLVNFHQFIKRHQFVFLQRVIYTIFALIGFDKLGGFQSTIILKIAFPEQNRNDMISL